MRARLTVALVVQILAGMFSLLGWVDALEGGLAVVIAALVTVAARLIGKVPVPRFTWISLVATIALSFTTIGLLLAAVDPSAVGDQFANNPLTPAIQTLSMIYRVGAVAVIAGTIFYAVKIIDARRRA